MASERSSPQSDFLAECECAFAFLLREYSFTGPQVESSLPGLVFATFRKAQVGVECLLEHRNDDVSVKVIRLKNGNMPTAYRKDEAGAVVREYLTHLLLGRGVRDTGFPQPRKEKEVNARRMAYRKALEGYARMLRRYAPDVLAGSERILDEVQ